ncbi:4327_t:CDS:2 [Diversispora eburnea]|uniref:4327_t:CDS:1 n=1 Tax=Diversispora eburnea TaxID=1213867 RepID=A0A9N9AGH5_9GLOM|nr:4327_t:CDS:2 [Diversispora eburnea]
MDPYRPNHYAPYRPSYDRQQYIPPGGSPYGPSSRPGFVPGGQPSRPGYVAPRPGYGQMVPTQIMTTTTTEVEKLTTLFIGGISPGVTDDWMEKILKTCGSLKSWKRVKDQSGNPKAFGFAEYSDADSVLRALRVLGGEGAGDDKKDKGVVLPALEEGASGKKLIVKADENTRKYLDQYEASRPRTVHDSELDKNALLAVISVVEDMTKPPQEVKEQSLSSLATSPRDNKSVNRSSPLPEQAIDHIEKDDDTDLPADLPPEQKDLIYREIAFFRERAAARERERQKEEEERATRRAKAEQARERSSHGRETRERQYGHYHQPVNFVPARESRRESYVLDDEEEEQRRQAKRKTEMEMAFKERERRWQHREETMAANRERDSEREIDMREKQIRDKELMARKLAEWDDDTEAERGQEEYYRDRQQFRAREMALDEQDRIREQQEIEAEQRKIEWERVLEEEKKLRMEAMEAELNKEEEATLIANASNGSTPSNNNNVKAKLTLNISSKRRSTLMAPVEEEDEDEDDEIEVKKKRRVLVPLEYSDNEDDEKRTEDRKKKIKELVNTIPSDKEGLWKWNTILDNKLRPFVSKKIVGYLGVQEDELVSFVTDHLRNNKSAAQLTKEMEVTLDEESELFVMKLWRMLIYETESKARKL